MSKNYFIQCILVLTIFFGCNSVAVELQWNELPPLPNPDGVAGPVIGVHNDALIVGGGANFPNEPLWETDKVWHDTIHVLTKSNDGYKWVSGGKLPEPRAYGSSVSTKQGVVCIGGNDGVNTFDDVILLSWDPDKKVLTQSPMPSLPKPCSFSSATLVDNVIYLAGGLTDNELSTAMKNFWALDLSKANDPKAFKWEVLDPWPGPERALNITASQFDGESDGIYVISGRRQIGEEVEFLTDTYEYQLSSKKWRKRATTPQPVMAGIGIGWGKNHIFTLGGASGSLWGQVDILKDDHPGFPKVTYGYNTLTDTWSLAGKSPANHVTTVPVLWDSAIIIPSGEVRPRVRSPKIWRITPNIQQR
jgi:solute:Na+ symporter, SSS family